MSSICKLIVLEVVAAIVTLRFGLHSGAALATVVGVLAAVWIMRLLARFAYCTTHWCE